MHIGSYTLVLRILIGVPTEELLVLKAQRQVHAINPRQNLLSLSFKKCNTIPDTRTAEAQLRVQWQHQDQGVNHENLSDDFRSLIFCLLNNFDYAKRFINPH